MRSIWNSFLVGFSMYSKLPMPKSDWTKDNMRYAICFFPLVGAVIGAFILLGYFITTYLGFGKILSAIIYITIPILVTGGIHMDGLLDTIDALSSYQPQERKLEILKDPHSGAFAVIYCVVYMLLSFGIWSEADGKTIGLLACIFVLSRALSGFGVMSLKMAKRDGTATVFADTADKRRVKVIMIVYIVITGGLMLWLDGMIGTICLLAALLVFIYYRYMAYKQFGGITGDLAGFFLQICELVMAAAIIFGGAV